MLSNSLPRGHPRLYCAHGRLGARAGWLWGGREGARDDIKRLKALCESREYRGSLDYTHCEPTNSRCTGSFTPSSSPRLTISPGLSKVLRILLSAGAHDFTVHTGILEPARDGLGGAVRERGMMLSV